MAAEKIKIKNKFHYTILKSYYSVCYFIFLGICEVNGVYLFYIFALLNILDSGNETLAWSYLL